MGVLPAVNVIFVFIQLARTIIKRALIITRETKDYSILFYYTHNCTVHFIAASIHVSHPCVPPSNLIRNTCTCMITNMPSRANRSNCRLELPAQVPAGCFSALSPMIYMCILKSFFYNRSFQTFQPHQQLVGRLHTRVLKSCEYTKDIKF